MSMKKIAVVTGASSGFGREFVRLFVKEKKIDEIWAIARNPEKLGRLKGECGEKVRIISMDLTCRKNYPKISALLQKENADVRFLVNNAGFAKFCSYDDIDTEESLNMIDLNIAAVVAMGLICIPHMNKGSHIINVASQASFFPLPYLNIYSSTKAFVRNYTRALNVELKEKGITATAVCPGWMNTELFERGKIGAKKEIKNFFGIVNPNVVAKKALNDAKRKKDISVYGVYVKSTHFLSKILPQKAMMRLWIMQQGGIK